MKKHAFLEIVQPAVQKRTNLAFLVTCEHGGNRIPPRYSDQFSGLEDVLNSHRGFDPGALQFARYLARRTGGYMVSSTVSRLLVDLNRSLHHPDLHVEWMRLLPEAELKKILAAHYIPFRKEVESYVARQTALGKTILHISSHSFTPVMNGAVRNADIGLLYDPSRPLEAALCQTWKLLLQEACAGLRVRRNYPYRGTSDGFVTFLRTQHDAHRYVGVELEVNQAQLSQSHAWRHLQRMLATTYMEAVRLICSPPMAK